VKPILGASTPQLYALMRILFGFLFSFHGAQKILGMFGGLGQDGGTAAFGTMVWFAGIIELFGGLAIMIGLFAPLAAFIAAGEMAVAYWTAHFSTAAFWPVQNGGELACLYCFAFLFIAAYGSGIWSVDHAMRSKAV